MTDFVGFKVELQSPQLGNIVGTVKTYSENKIELIEACINGVATAVKQYTIDKSFITGLKIIAAPPAASLQDASKQIPALHQITSTRDLRRDKLRNIPGACTAYICDVSPPRIVKTPKNLHTGKKCTEFGTNRGVNSYRSNSAGEGCSEERCSGCESDPTGNANSKNKRSPNSRHNNSNDRSRNENHHRGVNRRQGSVSAWDSLRIEDFIDEDFDFEANNALFDKQAFYRLTDAQEDGQCIGAGDNSQLSDLFSEKDQILVEGPDGIGFVPFPRQQTPSASTITPTKSWNPKSSSPRSVAVLPCAPFWTTYTPNQPKVPILYQTVHQRLLHFLATGQDYDNVVALLPLGLGWDRLIERAGQAISNAAVGFLRQSGSSTRSGNHRTPHQQPPMRMLVLPGCADLPGAIAVNIARQLAERGAACVLLHPPSSRAEAIVEPMDETETLGRCGGGSTYRVELTLAQTYAPKLPLFEDELDDDNEEAEAEDTESDLFSQAARMWISRLPGLKIVQRDSGVTSRPKNSPIDILVLSQPLDKYPANISQWLNSHTAISLAIQLHTPSTASGHIAEDLTPSQSVKSWLIQLGLPCIAPTQCPPCVDVQLIDVGMSRCLVTMVTGDLRMLPPPGLFDSTSCVQLIKGPKNV